MKIQRLKKEGEMMNNLKTIFKRALEGQGKVLALLLFVKAIFDGVMPFINIFGLSMIINDVLVRKNLKFIIIKILLILSLNFFIKLFSFLLNYFNNKIERKLTNKLISKNTLDNLYIDYHYSQDGTVESLRRKSIYSMPWFFLDKIQLLLTNSIKIILSVIAIIKLTTPLVLIVFLFSFLIVFVQFFQKRNEKKMFFETIEENKKMDYLYNGMTDFKNVKDIKTNNAKELFLQKFESSISTQAKKINRIYNKILFLGVFDLIFLTVQMIGIYLWNTYQVLNNYNTIPEYLVLVSASFLINTAIVVFFVELFYAINTAKATKDYLKYEDFIKNNSKNFYEGDSLIENANENIFEFKNVYFKYPNSSKYVIENLNLKIKEHSSLAIVGLNGAGKTTIIKLLLKLYQPTKGTILFYGADIKDIKLNEYVRKISLVLQDFSFFAYSIGENFSLENELDEKWFSKALAFGGIKEKILSLPLKEKSFLSKKLSNEGVDFSGGELQKLAISRAHYKNGKVYIFDEPSSSLDPFAEYAFFEKIEKNLENKTKIFISHRLSSTKFCDQIIYLADGKIIERGNFKELIDKKGEYYELFSAQSKYYLEQYKNEI